MNLDQLKPHSNHKGPNTIDVNNIQAILENYKNTLQDQKDSDNDNKQETTQCIQNLVHQTLDNILIQDQKKLFRKEKCFNCGILG